MLDPVRLPRSFAIDKRLYKAQKHKPITQAQVQKNPQPNPPTRTRIAQSQQHQTGGKEGCDTKRSIRKRQRTIRNDDDNDNSKERGAKARECWIPVRNCPVVFGAVCLGRGVTRHSKRFVSAGFWPVIVLWFTQARDDCFGRGVSGHSR